MKHTKEPWRTSSFGCLKEMPQLIIRSRNGLVAIAGTINEGKVNAEANAKRIVDCVNNCEGINPKAVPDLLEACKYVREQLKNIKGKAFPIMPILNAITKAEEK